MKLTTFTDFGLRALILLADRKGEILSAAAIADHFHVSRHHMAKVLQELAGAGYVEGIRGAQGGVRLAREPRDIRIGDVVRSLDKEQALVDCFREGWNDCAFLPRCRLRGCWPARNRVSCANSIASPSATVLKKTASRRFSTSSIKRRTSFFRRHLDFARP